MRIQSIHLTNFRNFAEARVEFGQNLNVILGANAQGKTNLLEAIHILGVGRSHRDRKDANLVKFGEAYWRVEGIFDQIGVRTTIEVSYDQERKRIRLNGKETRPAGIIGIAPVVVSSPDDIDLIKGSPGLRRSFLDVAISQTSREYLTTLQNYWRALAQRNVLLREAQERGGRVSQTEVWDESVVEHGTRLVCLRLEFLASIGPRVEEDFNFISGASSSIALLYEPKGYTTGESAEMGNGSHGGAGRERETAIKAKLSSALKANRSMEIARGYTIFGPHVDDFSVDSDGRDMRLFGSEGEQRTAVLALRFAEAGVIKEKREQYPIVLLDDVFAELDDDRSRRVTALISKFDQIVLTSSRPHAVNRDDTRMILVSRGAIGCK